MRVKLSWYNITHNRRRTATALAGIAFSILLVFMQLGFLDTARRGSTVLYQHLDFDLLITSDKYEILDGAGQFERTRLIQALVAPGVAQASPFYIGRAFWEDKQTELSSTLLLFGVDLDPGLFRWPRIRDQLPSLAPPNTVMLDTLSHANYGPMEVGREAEINEVDVRIASLFELGLGFYREGSALVSVETYHRLMREDAGLTSLGLVKVAPGGDPLQVRRALREILPSDVLVWERRELIEREQDYFLSVKPVGIIFQAGALVALIVGGVILFQVLSTEIANKLGEYATLKAVGYADRYIYRVGVEQALLYAAISYMAALAGTFALFALAHQLSRLPIHLTAGLALEVLALTLAVCTLSTLLALQKLRRADPADLF